MAKTPTSALQPYATPADFLARIDVRLAGLLARDDGTQASPSDLLTDSRLATALATASGVLEASVLASERYSVEDLQALTGNSLELLKDIVCGLAIQRLRAVRGEMEPSTYPLYQEALVWLQALHGGRAIFAFAETAEAGLPTTFRLQSSNFFNDTPSLTSNWTRSFGVRSNRNGGGGCGRF